jgi:hypothetical protein
MTAYPQAGTAAEYIAAVPSWRESSGAWLESVVMGGFALVAWVRVIDNRET